MRPVNLIPNEQRGLHGGVARTGPLLYIILGSLAVLLIGVVMLVLTSNKISERESEVKRLDVQKAVVGAQAAQLAPYVSFEQVADRRIESVTHLADGRFDWERIIRQLSYILPPGSSLLNLHASSGGSNPEGAAFAVSSPSLSIIGCASGQDEAAAVVAAMKQIDGVTRVGLAHSTIESGEEGETKCLPSQAEFELIATFDEAPSSLDSAGGVSTVEETPAEPAAEEGSGEAESTEEGAEGTGETASAGSPEGTG